MVSKGGHTPHLLYFTWVFVFSVIAFHSEVRSSGSQGRLHLLISCSLVRFCLEFPNL